MYIFCDAPLTTVTKEEASSDWKEGLETGRLVVLMVFPPEAGLVPRRCEQKTCIVPLTVDLTPRPLTQTK